MIHKDTIVAIIIWVLVGLILAWFLFHAGTKMVEESIKPIQEFPWHNNIPLENFNESKCK